jgi:translocation and assembly module TamA
MHRNLLGGAERLRIEGLVSNIDASDSGVDYSLGITLDRPATFTPDTTLGFGVEIARLDEADFTADLLSLETTVSHIFSPTLTGRLGIGYDYLDGRDDTGRFLYENLAFPVGLTWDLRDSTTDPTRGYFIDGEIKPFLGFGTTDSGGRLYLDARAYHGIGGTPERRDFVVAGRLQAGSIVGADILGTPRNYLFYSGGGGTVRGQPYQSLGVDLATDDGVLRTGGSVFLGGSVELRARLNDTFGVVGFLDAGQVSDGSLGDSSSEWHAGAGIGARYNTTVGPIRFDVALPVSGDTGDGVQFYIGLGQAF